MPITAAEAESADPSCSLANTALKSSYQTGPALGDDPSWLEVQCQDGPRSLASAGCSPSGQSVFIAELTLAVFGESGKTYK